MAQVLNVGIISPDQKLSFDKRKARKAAKTKQYHKDVISSNGFGATPLFSFTDYETSITPHSSASSQSNVKSRMQGNSVKLCVHHDLEETPFARMKIIINPQRQLSLFEFQENSQYEIEVMGYGKAPETIQTMWNAVDDLVIRSSSYNSLFELYGHFTEPHPVFEILEFEGFSEHPILEFARHVSDFANCSRYFSKSHLVNMFGSVFGKNDFIDIVGILRGYRFDIRCPETNIAITDDVYMVTYPFTLPYRKQMNVSLR